jgi:hypothetical protein
MGLQPFVQNAVHSVGEQLPGLHVWFTERVEEGPGNVQAAVKL